MVGGGVRPGAGVSTVCLDISSPALLLQAPRLECLVSFLPAAEVCVPLGRTWWCSTTVWDGPTGLSLGCVLRLMVLPFSLLRRGRRM